MFPLTRWGLNWTNRRARETVPEKYEGRYPAVLQEPILLAPLAALVLVDLLTLGPRLLVRSFR